MESSRRFPLWVWWVIGLAAAVAIAAVAVLLVFRSRPSIPPGIVELRGQVAKVLEDATRLPDVDIQPLVDLESKGDFAGAAALLDQALQANAGHETLSSSLASLSEQLAKLSVEIKPDPVATQAIEAFGILAQLAQAERKFYAGRRALYEMTREYYLKRAANETPAIPAGLNQLVDAVNADFEKARELHQRFAAAVKAFDEAVSRR